MNADDSKNQFKGKVLIIGYPFVLLLMSVCLNFFLFTAPSEALQSLIQLPTIGTLQILSVSSIILFLNHIWIMTATELTRLRFNMHSTPEQWAQSGVSKNDVSQEGLDALERCHNAHRNTTENVLYFAILSICFCIVVPSTLISIVWLIGFSLSRLGYTYGYLSKKDGVRELFMSLSLLSLFGLTSFLLFRLF